MSNILSQWDANLLYPLCDSGKPEVNDLGYLLEESIDATPAIYGRSVPLKHFWF
jgi:hypothetical protein